MYEIEILSIISQNLLALQSANICFVVFLLFNQRSFFIITSIICLQITILVGCYHLKIVSEQLEEMNL